MAFRGSTACGTPPPFPVRRAPHGTRRVRAGKTSVRKHDGVRLAGLEQGAGREV